MAWAALWIIATMPEMLTETRSVYLDSLSPLKARVGYGQLGLRGTLGYEGKLVSVQHKSYPHAISCHPPASILFHLDGRFSSFRSDVALNDDVAHSNAHADFIVLVDGIQAAAATYMQAGTPPTQMTADVSGAQVLELVVQTSHWECCHAVWLNPSLESSAPEPAASFFVDCLRRAEITLPAAASRARRCVATVVSPGFEALADDMLGSFYANGNCQDAFLVLFMMNKSSECVRLAAKYKALLVSCRSCAPVNPMTKALMYSVARVVDAEQYICLDGDMIILDSLEPIFTALDACPEGSILAAREGNGTGIQTVQQAFFHVYGGSEAECQQLLTAGEASYPLVINDGIFAGSRSALLALDGVIRRLNGAPAWIDQRHDIWWRNQLIFNLALAKLRCGVELDGSYNVQLHAQDVDIQRVDNCMRATWRGRPVRILHLSGVGRRKYPQWQGLFARVPDPLAGCGGPDSYSQFLRALRRWIGNYGVAALAWSFYGTSDAMNGRVRDSGTFPLFALLHYLVRSSGCARVLETGTARGVSAACLASAVVHRRDARVVSFDPYSQPEAAELWALLPENIRACIEPRSVDSLTGMQQAIEDREHYDLALLDSVHTAEHVWAEFQLASRLVCTGGLILIHDARYQGGTVPVALEQIEQAGFSVTRLWSAECGVAEDDELGLAVIENRRRASGESRA
jgi:predicted O-methyltransferase YrrM